MSFSLLIIFNGRNSWKDRPTGSTGVLMGKGAVDPRNKIEIWFISRFSGLVSHFCPQSEAAFLGGGGGGGGGGTVPPLFQVPLKCPLIILYMSFSLLISAYFSFSDVLIIMLLIIT